MKEAIAIIVIVLLVSLGALIHPAWWWIMLIPIIFGAFFPSSIHRAFFLAFLAGIVVWGGHSVFQYSNGSQIITDRVSELFSLPSGGLLIFIIALFGGILSGTAAATGSSIRSFFTKSKRRKINYY